MSLLGYVLSILMPKHPLREGLIALALGLYVLGVLGLTKVLYDIMRRRGLPHNVAVYYNRKVIHVLGGGLVALLVPFLFTSPTIPLILSIALAILCYIPHKTGKLLYWFQVPDNMYEVNFCIMWGLALLVLWLVLANPYLAIVPLTFMAFGDAATGVVRNLLFRRRTKHWIGNIAMFSVCAPVGLYYAGLAGLIAALASSIVERFEFNPIDDNVLITITATAILLIAHAFALI